MNTRIALSNAINELGNALTAAEWPVKAVHGYDGRMKLYDLKEVYRDLLICADPVMHEADDFHDCVNELCLMCGKYRNEHLGACDGCRWKDKRGK